MRRRNATSGARRSIATSEIRAGIGGEVVISGGGIAGMTAAAAFARRGAAVTVLEQAQAIREIGAGLQITPNGGAVLAALGLSDEADRRSIRARAVEPMDALSGHSIARFDLTGLSGPPYRFFHRADLLDLLAGAARGVGAQVLTGSKVTTITPSGEVRAGDRDWRPMLAIGADGLHSVLRPALNPGQGAAFFTGQIAWRALIKGDHPPVARIWMAPGRHLVTYPLPGGRINLVAVREAADWQAEGWHHPDDPANLAAAFADCAPDLRALLARVETVNLWGLFRHPVAQIWHGPAAALIGDAAHPTLPFLGQGANLAIEDAWALADCVAHHGLAGLPRYQAARRPRVTRAIAAANANARNYHLRGLPRRVAHLGLSALSSVAPRAFLSRLDWLYGHDVTGG